MAQPEFRSVTPQELYAKYLEKDLTPSRNSEVTVAINMIATIDGVTTIPQKSGIANEQGIGHRVDQRLMRVLRVHADATLNGAHTLEISGAESRVDDYPELAMERRKRGKPENPVASVLTTKAAFSDVALKRPFFTDPSFQSILYVAENAPAENITKVRKASLAKADAFHVEFLPAQESNIAALLENLKTKYQVKTLLVEGGSGVNGSFALQNKVNDVFLTEAPYIAVASPQSKTTITGPKTLSVEELLHAELVSAYFVPETGMTFKHYKVVLDEQAAIIGFLLR